VRALQIDDVTVTFSSLSTGAASPGCGAPEENVISIEFRQQFGALPAARVDGSRLGFSGGGAPVLTLVSTYALSCGGEASGGSVYFLYDGSVSRPVAFDATGADIAAALSDLDTLGGRKAT